MILRSLVDYYEILLERNEIEDGKWEEQQVNYAITIDRNGQLVNIISLMSKSLDAKKEIPVSKVVPIHKGRSKKPVPYFLCDTAKYLLGVWVPSGEPNDDEKSKEQAKSYFQKSADYHKKILSTSEHSLAQSVLKFFEKWDFEKNKEQFESIDWKRVSQAKNLIFRLYETSEEVIDCQEIKELWNNYDNDEDKKFGRCLVTGRYAPIALLHPVIKGIEGTQPKLVSFNASAFESYGKEQGENAPISEYAASAYGKALNYLLSERTHCRYIGDITMVFWAETKDSEDGYMYFIEEFLGNTEKPEEDKLLHIMDTISKGKPCDYENLKLKPDTKFYILGLSSNNGRISVCLFYTNTFKDLIVNVQKHYDRLSIQSPVYEQKQYPSVYDILNAVTRKQTGSKDNSQSMKGIEKALLNSILINGRYPSVLYISTLNRVSAEICQNKNIGAYALNRNRAAVMKAYIMQNYPDKKEVVGTMQLNEETDYVPYVLGRLFAVLEDVQKASIDKETLREHYFNVASRTPALVFPRLMRLSNNYMKVLKREKEGLRIAKEKEINALFGKLHTDIPMQLSLEDQGIFMLGYYHQVQKRYEKNNKDEQ